MNPLQSKLAELKRLALSATPGPWIYRWPIEVWVGKRNSHGNEIIDRWVLAQTVCYPESKNLEFKNAAHIAAFNPETALKLLESLEIAYQALEQSGKDICTYSCIHGPPRPHCPSCVDAQSALTRIQNLWAPGEKG